MRKLFILLIAFLAIAYVFRKLSVDNLGDRSHIHTPSASPEPSQTSEAPTNNQFGGDSCSGDCSGHEAGYAWAEEHDIDDEEDCDTAGDNSISPSFAEGCKDYVNEMAPNSSDNDNDSDDDDDNNDSLLMKTTSSATS